MKWSRGHKVIFDGGAVGKDAVDVFPPDRIDDPRYRVFAFEDITRPEDGLPPPSPPTPNPAPPVAAPVAAAPVAETSAVVGGPRGDEISPAELQRREDAAYERGRQDGLSGLNEQVDRLAQNLEGAVSFFHDTMAKIDEQASRQALELGLMVAEQLFRTAVEVQPDRLTAVVEELSKETEGGPLRIVVDPSTAQHWRNCSDALQELLKERSFEVEPNNDLTPGDVIVHSGNQTLDERIEHRVRQYKQALEQELGIAVES